MEQYNRRYKFICTVTQPKKIENGLAPRNGPNIDPDAIQMVSGS
jgi:hypothetical protein